MSDNQPQPNEIRRYLNQLVQGAVGLDESDAEKIARYGGCVGAVIESHRVLDRAMDHARSQIEAAAAAGRSYGSGTVILADTMHRCKGRFTRSWHAPEGGVWGCMVHANDLLPQSRQFIPLAVGLACCRAVRSLGAEQAAVRWVNDVLCGGKKLAGFLVEGYTEPRHREEFTLVGFGININNTEFPGELTDIAVSLRQILNREVDLRLFTTRFLAHLAYCIGCIYFEEHKQLQGDPLSGPGGEHLLLSQFRELSDTIGKRVVFGFDVLTAPQYTARVLGIDGFGGLILELDDGHIKTEYSGEVRYLDSP